MKHALLLILLWNLTLGIVTAQNQRLDSLEAKLANHKKGDTIRLNLLNNLANGYSDIDPKKGLFFADKQMALAKILGKKASISSAYINKANNYLTLSNDSLALKCYEKALEIDTSINDFDGQAVALYGMAWILHNNGEYVKAIKHYQRCHDIFESLNDQIKMAAIYNAIGISQMYMNDYQRSLDSFLQALKVYNLEGMSESQQAALTLGNIGLIYNRMEKNLELGIQYHEKALKIHQQNGNKYNEANTISNMANAYDNLKQSEKAIELQQQAYIIFEELDSKRGMANALTNIGIAYTSIDYRKTEEYLLQTLPIYRELNDKHGQTIALNYLGEALLNSPLTKTNLTNAEDYLLQGLNISKEAGYAQSESDITNLLAQLYTKKNNYEKAYHHKIRAVQLHDSIMSQENLDKIARLEEQYKYEKKEAEINAEHEKKQTMAQAEIERQKLIKIGSFFSVGLLLLSGGIGLFLYKRKRDALDKQHNAEYKATVAETELKALRAQMNPHFIFNSLNSIGDYISKHDTAQAKSYLSKFAKIMRQTLEHSNMEEIPLKNDLELLDNYLQMESLRLSNKFTYSIIVDKDIDIENTLVPPMILQPFVENSIWHGVSKLESNGHIEINISKTSDTLVCKVEDNGIGIQEDSLSETVLSKRSLGQNITQKRIEIINNNKNANGNVTIQNKTKGQGVKVEVRLPLELAF